MVPWTLPPIAVGFFMSGGNIATILWSVACVLVPVLVYYPFFRMADKREYAAELEAQKAEQAAQEA